MISTSRRLFSIFNLTLLLLSAGCGVRAGDQNTPTLTPLIPTATYEPTRTLAPSGTPPPPPAPPTVAPVEGIASTQLNVRSEPSTAGNVVGIIPASTKLEIVGRDPGGNWWQILYPQGVDGKGWVTAQYVTTASQPQVPIVGSGGTDPNNGSVAVIQQQINVRSGPGTGFNSLGTLNAQDVVSLTGKDANGAWLQIAFSSGPDGKGWVNAAFVQATGVENLPIVTEAGRVIGTGTPTGIPFTPTPTVIPAWLDNDSQNAPVASTAFESSGTHMLIYNGDVSAPDGDLQDWIQFVPYNDILFVSIDCMGSNTLQADVLENGLPTALGIACGDQMKRLNVRAGSTYLIHLQASQSTSGLQYTSYIVTIESSP